MLEHKKTGDDQAIGRSRGGLSTKIHTTCDALGNPTGFYLTAGQAHDLDGADALLPEIEAKALLADRAYDAEARVRQILSKDNCEAVIPSTSKRKVPYPYDRELYRTHLVSNIASGLTS